MARRSVAGALPGTPDSKVVLSDSAAFSPDGRLLAVSFSDGAVGVWSVATDNPGWRRSADSAVPPQAAPP